MENEHWIPWSVNERYHISGSGKIKDTKLDKIVSNNRASGYVKVSLIPDESINLYAAGYRKNVSVHILVAQAFIPNPDNLPQVRFKDKDKSNCKAWNLEWCDYNRIGPRNVKRGEQSPMFGRKASFETRKRMAEAKLGKNHPKFKGYYSKDGKLYTTAMEAQEKTGINHKSVARYAKDGKHGWSFVPAKQIRSVDFESKYEGQDMPVPTLQEIKNAMATKSHYEDFKAQVTRDNKTIEEQIWAERKDTDKMGGIYPSLKSEDESGPWPPLPSHGTWDGEKWVFKPIFVNSQGKGYILGIDPYKDTEHLKPIDEQDYILKTTIFPTEEKFRKEAIYEWEELKKGAHEEYLTKIGIAKCTALEYFKQENGREPADINEFNSFIETLMFKSTDNNDIQAGDEDVFQE